MFIDLNGLQFKDLEGDEISVEIPAATIAALGVSVVTIGVSF